MGDVVLVVEDLKSASATAITSTCRICHEEELESYKSLEAPCACSGTVKFAHRDCIQTWCNEKGNTVCEICLQKYEPGYTAPAKISQLVEAVVTIRGSLQVPSGELEPRNPESSATAEEPMLETEWDSSEANRRFNYCRKMALTFTFLLLVRDILDVVTHGTEGYPFNLITLLIIRATGIVLPMFLFIRLITAIQKSVMRRHQVREDYEHRIFYIHS